MVCRAFAISETCYRYQPKLSDENAEIADWLLRLTQTYKRWGFGLCFIYLRNIKGYGWNHKRVYRIYRELELNLRIKPRRRIKRNRPDELSEPVAINQVWSMDFMSVWATEGASEPSMYWMTTIERGSVLRSISLYQADVSFVHWSRSSNGAGNHWRCVATTGQNTSVRI